MLNKVQFIGRLGQDPELKNLPSGSSVVNFTIACSESWKDKKTGEKQEKTEWIKCQAFGKIAELIHQYLKKGSLAYVEGKWQTRSWDDKEGKKQYMTEALINEVKFLSTPGEKSEKKSSPRESYGVNPDGSPAQFTADDIPF